MPTYSFKNKYGVNVVVDGHTSVPSQIFDQDAKKYIRFLHDGEYRLHCDCTETGAVSHPCLYTDHGTYYLRQSKSRPHDKDCPLVGVLSGDYNPPTLGTKPPKIKPYQPGDKVADGKGQNAQNKGEGGSRQNSLYTMLCHLLAGKTEKGYVLFNRYTRSRKFNWGSLYYSLLAASPFIDKTKLASLLNTPSNLKHQPNQKFVNWFIKQIRKKVPPQIYTVAVSGQGDYSIDDDGSCQFTDSDGVERNLQPRKPSHRFKQTVGPRLFFFIEAYVDGEWIVPSLYSHPIVSIDTPILVDSNHERNFFIFASEQFVEIEQNHTRQLQQIANDKGVRDNEASVSYAIVKPYFAKTFKDKPNVPLIPDFKLTRSCKYFDISASYDLLVEVMGITDPNYIARKEDIIPAMENRLRIKVAKVKPETMGDDFKLLMGMKWSRYKKDQDQGNQ